MIAPIIEAIKQPGFSFAQLLLLELLLDEELEELVVFGVSQ